MRVVLLLKNLVRMREREQKKTEAHEMVIGDGESPSPPFQSRFCCIIWFDLELTILPSASRVLES